MSFEEEYSRKLVSAQTAAEQIRSGDWVEYGWSITTPVAIDAELAKRMDMLCDVNFRGGLLQTVPEIFKIENPAEHFTWNSWHMGSVERKAAASGFCFYIPLRYSELPGLYRQTVPRPDVAIVGVSPMDEHGYFSFGPSVSHLAAVCERSKKVIVEVNRNIPRCLGTGEAAIHISDVDLIVEGDNPPLFTAGNAPATEIDKAIAKLVVEEIPNGACLQLGIGSMPNTVGGLIADSDLKNLGIHSEMYVDSMVDLALSGKVNGKLKNVDKGLQTYSFAIGSKRLYDYLDANPACNAAPVGYVNDIGVISSIDNFISINNAVNLDLFGQIGAESAGLRQISGAGGQLDFVMGAYMSKGGKSFVCCSSTYETKTGEVKSRILPTLPMGTAVTDTRANTQYVVTEYGKVNLKGLSTWQRAEALISIAHPDFRDELVADAEKMGVWRNTNRR